MFVNERETMNTAIYGIKRKAFSKNEYSAEIARRINGGVDPRS